MQKLMKDLPGVKTETFMDSAFYVAALSLAYVLKMGYSRAGADALVWILAPIAGFVRLVGRIPFYYEAHTGYVNPDIGVIIAPVCSGINLLIVSFGMAVFVGIRHQKSPAGKLSWFVFSMLAAYAWSIPVNGARIILSIFLYNLDIYDTRLTPSAVHRIFGTAIYFFCHCQFYFIIKRISMIRCQESVKRPGTGVPGSVIGGNFLISLAVSGGIPLGWYVGITLVVPLINGAYGQDENRFLSHGITVACVSMMLYALILLCRTGFHLFIKRLREDTP
jgi:exosortase K